MLKIVYLITILFLGSIYGCETTDTRMYKLDEKGNKIECERWPEPTPGDRIITGDYIIAKPRREIITEKPKKENIMSFEIPELPELK